MKTHPTRVNCSLSGTIIAAALAVIGFAGSMQAASVTVANFSFETPDGGADLVTTTDYVNNPSGTSWSRSGNWGIQDWKDADFAGATGDVAVLPGTADGYQAAYIGFGATIYQDVGALLADTTYTLTVAIGDRLSKAYADTITLQFYNGTDLTGTLLGSQLSDDVAPNGSFADYSFSFTSGASVTGDLVIALFNPNGTGHTVVDNVRLTAVAASAIPEPSAYAALAGALGLGYVASRRRLRR